MQIVIDIPNNIIVHISDGSFKSRTDDEDMLISAVMDGIPLPKGHGRLIDTNQLLKEARDIVVPVYPHGYEYRCYCVPADSIYEAPTIIEADKEAADDSKRT